MKKYEVVYKLPDWIDIDYLHWHIYQKIQMLYIY